MSKGFLRVKVVMSKSMQNLIKNNERMVSNTVIPVLNRYGAQAEKEIKKELSIGGYGPLRKPKRKCTRTRVRDYTPSKKGDPPHLKTGALRSSIGFIVNSKLGTKLQLIIGSLRSGTARDRYLGTTQTFVEGIKYSGKLEDKDRLDRPFLAPIMDRYKKEIPRTITRLLTKLFRGEK